MDSFFHRLPFVVLRHLLDLLGIPDSFKLGNLSKSMKALVFSNRRWTVSLKSFSHLKDAREIQDQLKRPTQVQALDFSGSYFGDVDLLGRMNVIKFDFLIAVNFNYCPLSEESLITFFANSKPLMYLGLAGCYVSEKIVVEIRKKACNIIVLDLDHANVPASALVSLICSCSFLMHLSIGLIAESMVPIIRSSSINIPSTLKTFTYGLDWTHCEDDISILLDRLTECDQLEEINFVNCKISEDKTGVIQSMKSLRTFTLIHCCENLKRSFKNVHSLQELPFKPSTVPSVERFFGQYFSVKLLD